MTEVKSKLNKQAKKKKELKSLDSPISRTIEKLRILEKILKQQGRISINKNLGHQEIVDEINIEVKEYINSMMNKILNHGAISYQSSASAISFTDNEVTVLKEMAQRLIQRNKLENKGDVTPTPPKSQPSVNSRSKESPVMSALKQAGFVNMNPAEKKAYIKELEKAAKEQIGNDDVHKM